MNDLKEMSLTQENEAIALLIPENSARILVFDNTPFSGSARYP
jgi:hypothetical protein